MANLNKVMLIGRLTRDPEVRTIASGSKVANFGFAVNNKKKNATTGQWEDEPVFIDVKAWNRGEKGRQLADLVEQYMRKGQQFYLEGHLQLDQWTNQEGQKQSRLRLVMDDFQFLEPRGEGSSSGPRAGSSATRPSQPSPAPMSEESYDHSEAGADSSPPSSLPAPAGGQAGQTGEDIPF